MRTDLSIPVKLEDYRPYPFSLDNVHLTFQLTPTSTTVLSVLRGQRSVHGAEPLRLDGENLKLLSIKLNGKTLRPSSYDLTNEALTIPLDDQPFVLEIATEISPESNTQLSGLYMSGGRYCTQCEAEGFRRITYYPDRPDVMAPFEVRIEAPKAKCSYLLSNGNLKSAAILQTSDIMQNGSILIPSPPICSHWWLVTLMS